MKKYVLMESATGRVSLNAVSYLAFCRVSLLFKYKYGLKREGKRIGVGSPFEAYYRDFVKGDLKIVSDWEGMAGYSWLANNEETEQFLKDFYKNHCK